MRVRQCLAYRPHQPGRRGLVVGARVVPAACQRRVPPHEPDHREDAGHPREPDPVDQQTADREPEERAEDAEDKLHRGHRDAVLVALRDVRHQRLEGCTSDVAGEPEALQHHDQPEQVGDGLVAKRRHEEQEEQERPPRRREHHVGDATPPPRLRAVRQVAKDWVVERLDDPGDGEGQSEQHPRRKLVGEREQPYVEVGQAEGREEGRGVLVVRGGVEEDEPQGERLRDHLPRQVTRRVGEPDPERPPRAGRVVRHRVLRRITRA